MKLVIDANILVGELLRKRGRELLRRKDLTLHASEQVTDEAQYELNRRVTRMVTQDIFAPPDGQILLAAAQEVITAKVQTIATLNFLHLETAARKRIPRDPNDWTTVAISLLLNAAIWTQDCDFLGYGCPTWTTETLLLNLTDRSDTLDQM
jgi:predicted nucleic acid-binding protein